MYPMVNLIQVNFIDDDEKRCAKLFNLDDLWTKIDRG
jgi:hypothetical protein